MAIVRKPVTRKPSWLTGIVVPCLVGVGFGTYAIPSTAYNLYLWYMMAGWQFMCGLAMIFERAPVYGATSIPQSQRLCELYGLSWLGIGVLTIVAAKELLSMEEVQKLSSMTSLPVTVLVTTLVCTFGFSIAAGPTRLVNANDNEMKLVPLNSFLVALMMTTLLS